MSRHDFTCNPSSALTQRFHRGRRPLLRRGAARGGTDLAAPDHTSPRLTTPNLTRPRQATMLCGPGLGRSDGRLETSIRTGLIRTPVAKSYAPSGDVQPPLQLSGIHQFRICIDIEFA